MHLQKINHPAVKMCAALKKVIGKKCEIQGGSQEVLLIAKI